MWRWWRVGRSDWCDSRGRCVCPALPPLWDTPALSGLLKREWRIRTVCTHNEPLRHFSDKCCLFITSWTFLRVHHQHQWRPCSCLSMFVCRFLSQRVKRRTRNQQTHVSVSAVILEELKLSENLKLDTKKVPPYLSMRGTLYMMWRKEYIFTFSLSGILVDLRGFREITFTHSEFAILSQNVKSLWHWLFQLWHQGRRPHYSSTLKVSKHHLVSIPVELYLAVTWLEAAIEHYHFIMSWNTKQVKACRYDMRSLTEVTGIYVSDW